MQNDFILIPESPFIMGASAAKEPDSETPERPERTVWVSSFWIGRVPVTVQEWYKFLDQTGYEWPRERDLQKIQDEALFPITQVNWFDCVKYTEWLQAELGEIYRLPTEAEWEKVCRGCDGGLYPWGDSTLPIEQNLRDYSGKWDSVHPVGQVPEYQSPYGCLDMWFNVGEWCLDWFAWDDEGYAWRSGPDERDPRGPANGIYKSIRGGFPLSSEWPRCSHRGCLDPRTRDEGLGFRLVKEAGSNNV